MLGLEKAQLQRLDFYEGSMCRKVEVEVEVKAQTESEDETLVESNDGAGATVRV